MKKLLFLLVFGVSGLSYGANIESYNHFDASYTATAETTQQIPNILPGDILAGVVVASVSTNGTLIVYNSSGVASGIVTNVDLGTIATHNYEVRLSSGLTYTTTGNTGGVTIIFKRHRAR